MCTYSCRSRPHHFTITEPVARPVTPGTNFQYVCTAVGGCSVLVVIKPLFRRVSTSRIQPPLRVAWPLSGWWFQPLCKILVDQPPFWFSGRPQQKQVAPSQSEERPVFMSAAPILEVPMSTSETKGSHPSRLHSCLTYISLRSGCSLL